MLQNERCIKIMNLLNQRESIEVKELSKILKVTGETIRRDLDKLEKEGKLYRTHGGAIKSSESQPEIPYFEREITNVTEKMDIAREALNYINQNDQIILDSSTTAWFVAKALPNISLTVLTNSIQLSTELAKKNKIEVICTGGILLQSSMCFVGRLTQSALSSYRVNKAFISSKGLHHHWGISEPNELAVMVKRKMVEISNEVYLLMDHSKFGVQDLIQIVQLDKIDWIITDSKTSSQQINDLKEFSTRVIQV